MLHFLSMKLFYPVAWVLLVPGMLFGQGVRMSADFFPLEVGNRWVYDVTNESGQKIGDIDFAIQQHVIVGGRSFYVFTGFPFVAEGTGAVKLVRYDRQERQYTRMADNEEGALFLADGATAEVLQADGSGLPLKFILRMDFVDLTFQRGIGIVEARMSADSGMQIAKLNSVHVGDRAAIAAAVPQNSSPLPQPETPEQRTKASAENVVKASEENPVLDVQAVAVPEGHKFTLTVINTADKLLALSFSSGQTYDFAVIDELTGQEIWRWSRRMFFSQVVRQETVRASKDWRFEVVWNRRDNELNPVSPGKYRVIGFVATQPPIESDPVSFEIQ